MHHPDEPDLHLADEVRRLLVLARQEQAAAEAAFESLARRVTPRALSTAVVTVTNDLLDTRRWGNPVALTQYGAWLDRTVA